MSQSTHTPNGNLAPLLAVVKPSFTKPPENGSKSDKSIDSDDSTPRNSFSKAMGVAKKDQQAEKESNEKEPVADGKKLPVSEPELPDGVDLLAGTEMPDEVESEESTEEELLLLASRFAFESISRGTAGAAQAVNETAAVDNKTKPELLIKLEAGQSMAKSELDFGLMAKLTDLESLNGNTSETSNKLESVESLANRNQTLELRALNPTRVELAVPNRVGTLGWGESMAGKISLMMNQRLTSAKIHINPPELGPIEVRVNLNNDQASVQFTSHSSQVRDALEQSIPRLREMLETAGFSLADADVKDQSSDRQSDESGDADPETQEIADAETMQSRPISMGLIDERV